MSLLKNQNNTIQPTPLNKRQLLNKLDDLAAGDITSSVNHQRLDNKKNLIQDLQSQNVNTFDLSDQEVILRQNFQNIIQNPIISQRIQPRHTENDDSWQVLNENDLQTQHLLNNSNQSNMEHLNIVYDQNHQKIMDYQQLHDNQDVINNYSAHNQNFINIPPSSFLLTQPNIQQENSKKLRVGDQVEGLATALKLDEITSDLMNLTRQSLNQNPTNTTPLHFDYSTIRNNSYVGQKLQLPPVIHVPQKQVFTPDINFQNNKVQTNYKNDLFVEEKQSEQQIPFTNQEWLGDCNLNNYAQPSYQYNAQISDNIGESLNFYHLQNSSLKTSINNNLQTINNQVSPFETSNNFLSMKNYIEKPNLKINPQMLTTDSRTYRSNLNHDINIENEFNGHQNINYLQNLTGHINHSPHQQEIKETLASEPIHLISDKQPSIIREVNHSKTSINSSQNKRNQSKISSHLPLFNASENFEDKILRKIKPDETCTAYGQRHQTDPILSIDNFKEDHKDAVENMKENDSRDCHLSNENWDRSVQPFQQILLSNNTSSIKFPLDINIYDRHLMMHPVCNNPVHHSELSDINPSECIRIGEPNMISNTENQKEEPIRNKNELKPFDSFIDLSSVQLVTPLFDQSPQSINECDQNFNFEMFEIHENTNSFNEVQYPSNINNINDNSHYNDPQNIIPIPHLFIAEAQVSNSQQTLSLELIGNHTLSNEQNQQPIGEIYLNKPINLPATVGTDSFAFHTKFSNQIPNNSPLVEVISVDKKLLQKQEYCNLKGLNPNYESSHNPYSNHHNQCSHSINQEQSQNPMIDQTNSKVSFTEPNLKLPQPTVNPNINRAHHLMTEQIYQERQNELSNAERLRIQPNLQNALISQNSDQFNKMHQTPSCSSVIDAKWNIPRRDSLKEIDDVDLNIVPHIQLAEYNQQLNHSHNTMINITNLENSLKSEINRSPSLANTNNDMRDNNSNSQPNLCCISNDSRLTPVYPIFCFDSTRIIHFIKYFIASENGVGVDKYLVSDSEFIKFSELISDDKANQIIRNDSIEGIIINFQKLSEIQATFVGVFGRPALIMQALVDNQVIKQEEVFLFENYFKTNGSGLYLLPICLDKENMKMVLILYSDDQNDFDKVNEKKSYCRLLRYLTQLCNVNILAINQTDIDLINFVGKTKESRHKKFIPQINRVEEEKCELKEGKTVDIIQPNATLIESSSNSGYYTKTYFSEERSIKSATYKWKDVNHYRETFKGKNVKIANFNDIVLSDMETFFNSYYYEEFQKFDEYTRAKTNKIVEDYSEDIKSFVKGKVELDKATWVLSIMRKYAKQKFGLIEKNLSRLSEQRQHLLEKAFKIVPSVSENLYNYSEEELFFDIFLSCEKIALNQIIKENGLVNIGIEEFIHKLKIQKNSDCDWFYKLKKKLAYELIANKINEKKGYFEFGFDFMDIFKKVEKIQAQKQFIDVYNHNLIDDAFELFDKLLKRSNSIKKFEIKAADHKKTFISQKALLIRKNSYLEIIKKCLEIKRDAPTVTLTSMKYKSLLFSSNLEFSYEEETTTEPYCEYQIYQFELSSKDIENANEDDALILSPRAKEITKIKLNESYIPVDFILMKNGRLLILANRMGRSYFWFYNTQKLNEEPIYSSSFGNEILKSDYNESQKRITFYYKKEKDVFVVVYFISDSLVLRNEGNLNLTEIKGIDEVKNMKLGNSNDVFVLDDHNQVWLFDYKNSTGRKLKIVYDNIETLLLIPDTDCLLLVSKSKMLPYIAETDKALPEIQFDFKFDISSIFVSKLSTQIQLFFKNSDGVHHRLLKCSLSTKSYSLKSRNDTVNVNFKEIIRDLCVLDYFKFLYYKFSVYNPMEDLESQIISQRLLIYMSHSVSHNTEIEAKICKKLKEIQESIKKPFATEIGLSSNALFWLANQNNSESLFTFSRPKTLEQWIQEVISFVPIQIARPENNVFVIIQNGSPLKLDETKNIFDIQKKISFGLYESIFNSWNKDIKVISSMGKQSTGKSYTLNHLSGSTFEISAGRCTDGCWFTIKMTKDCLYVLMDFEGLGSFERSEQEDMLLSITNASLSSITLFKTEYSINKDTDQMFNRFNQGANFLKGNDKIFKGIFCILIKDVSDEDTKSLIEEFREKMDVIIKRDNQNDFITTMYKGGFDVYPFPSLALEDYYDEIDKLKADIQDIKATFNNGKEFLNLLKSIMAKIAIQDFTSLNRQDIEMRKHILIENIEVAFTYGNLSENREKKRDFIFKSYDLASIAVDELIELEIKCSNGDVLNISYDDPDIDLNHLNKSLINLLKRYMVKTRDNYVLWIELYRKLANAVVAKRTERVQEWVDINLRKWSDVFEFQDDISKLKQEVILKSKEIETKHKICLDKCDKCYSSCILFAYHSDSHICDFEDHKCQDKCGYCQIENEEQNCKLEFGHPEPHSCDTKIHSCGFKCKYKMCKNKCNGKIDHTGDHQCALSKHSCLEPCSLDNCSSLCCISADKNHTIHKCVSNQCRNPCDIKSCKIRCACLNHFHGYLQLSKTFKLENEIEEAYTGFIDEKGNCVDIDFHCCGNEHQCDHLCSQKGFCKVIVERKIVQEEFKGNRGKFTFKKQFENIGIKEKCYKKISPFNNTHSGNHTHSAPDPFIIHICETRCPTCNNICDRKFGHNGKHNTTHGNMEKCTFISTQKDFDVGDHNYVAGESSVAEMCHMFCKSLGRGHIHVMPCGNSQDNCPNEEEGIRRHESCQYGPDIENSKDEILHDAYWKSINFEDPCHKNESETFGKCPFYCGSAVHSNDLHKKYCQLDLWHPKITNIEQVCKKKGYVSSDGHYFECTHSNPSQGFHFVLCLDDSWSMSGNPLKELSAATIDFVSSRRSSQTDRLSIVQFSGSTKIMYENISFDQFDMNFDLSFRFGWTNFGLGIKLCHDIIKRNYKKSLTPVFIFMSDGDDTSGNKELVEMNNEFGPKSLKIFIIAFGSKLPKLEMMAQLVGGQYLTSVTGMELRHNFMDISSQFGTKIGVISSHK